MSNYYEKPCPHGQLSKDICPRCQNEKERAELFRKLDTILERVIRLEDELKKLKVANK